MNIIYLHAHDAGRFIGPYGYPIPAPNLQKLAEQGTLFRKAFCAAPSCSPSRAALVTGQYPHVCGMHGLATNKWGYTLNDYSQHLASFLKANGFQTALAGVQHVARLPWANPHEMGYDRLLNYESGSDKANAKATLSSALAFLSEKHDRPFFLSVGFFEPHRSDTNKHTFSYHRQVDEQESRYCQPLPIYPDVPETRKETANFKKGIEILDRQIGAILDTIHRNGLEEDTLVICTTDHGPGFPGMKCTLTDGGTGVFLIMRGPGGFHGGKVVDGMVTHMDLFPTLCELLNLDPPSWLQGKSFLPLTRGEAAEIHDEIFSEQGYHADYRPLRAIRTKMHKLILCFYTDIGESSYSTDPGPTHWLWRKHGWDQRPMPKVQLFDLMLDPLERCNVVDDPRYRPVLEGLQLRLEKWMIDTQDPLLHGGIPEPPAWKEKRSY